MAIMSKFPSKYLKAADIKPNEIVTIKYVKDEPVGREQEVKPVVFVAEYDRGIILNKTNAQAIVDGYGDDEVKWKGKKLALFTENVRSPSTGKMGPAIRMAPSSLTTSASSDPQRPLNEELNDKIPF
jgi:hypothetical protein